MVGVARARHEHLFGDLANPLRGAGAEHPCCSIVLVGAISALDLVHQRYARRIDVHDRDALQPTAIPEEVDRAPVGHVGHRERCQRR